MKTNIEKFALIIGSMKSGTTSLFNYLEQHPEVSPCRQKEPHFFSDASNFKRGIEYYQSLWDWDKKSHKIALEASTSYTGLKSVAIAGKLNSAANIAQFQRDYGFKFKFIYLMRNPIQRLESHYNHLKAGEYRNRQITINKLNLMIESSKYAMQLDEYYQRFAPENILLLKFDELKHEPAKLVTKVCRFLEVDSQFNFEDLEVSYNSHQNKYKNMIPGWHLIRKNKIVKSGLMSIPKELKYSASSLFSRKYDTEYVKFSLDEKEYILQQLNSDMQRLKFDYGFDLSSWKINV